jgi:hypothetical protein
MNTSQAGLRIAHQRERRLIQQEFDDVTLEGNARGDQLFRMTVIFTALFFAAIFLAALFG